MALLVINLPAGQFGPEECFSFVAEHGMKLLRPAASLQGEKDDFHWAGDECGV